MSLNMEFWQHTAEMQGREPDPMRAEAEAYKYSMDMARKANPLLTMPSNYLDRNVETSGAVTAS